MTTFVTQLERQLVPSSAQVPHSHQSRCSGSVPLAKGANLNTACATQHLREPAETARCPNLP